MVELSLVQWLFSLIDTLASPVSRLFDPNVIEISWHGQSFPHDVRVICVAFSRNWAVVIDLVERLELAK
jgi:hypothetical protein